MVVGEGQHRVVRVLGGTGPSGGGGGLGEGRVGGIGPARRVVAISLLLGLLYPIFNALRIRGKYPSFLAMPSGYSSSRCVVQNHNRICLCQWVSERPRARGGRGTGGPWVWESPQRNWMRTGRRGYRGTWRVMAGTRRQEPDPPPLFPVLPACPRRGSFPVGEQSCKMGWATLPGPLSNRDHASTPPPNPGPDRTNRAERTEQYGLVEPSASCPSIRP